MLEHYGYFVLFFGLMLELIALPLPGEFIMTYAGLIAYQGHLNWPLCILVAGVGSCIGMSVSYYIGYRLGIPFFEKYGRRFHFGPEKLEKVSRWYERYGNKLLLVAYFIPGVRHLTGIFSGIARLSFRKFALFAYTGAFFWVSLFISLGRLLGPEWEKYHHSVNRYMATAGIVLALVLVGVYLYRNYRAAIFKWISNLLNQAFEHYHSMGKVRFIVIGAFIVLVILTNLLIDLVQDFLAHEYKLFDEVTLLLVQRLFDPSWLQTMDSVAILGSRSVYISVFAITVIWIAFKGKDRLLELSMFIIGCLVGKGLNAFLQQFFHRDGPVGSLSGWSYPSEPTMLSIIVFGFAAYLVFRHYGNHASRVAAAVGVVAVCTAVGLSLVYLQKQYPSDAIAGYAFGGAWLCLSVILLEILRAIRVRAKIGAGGGNMAK